MLAKSTPASASNLAQAHYTVMQQTRFLEGHGEYHTYGLMAVQKAPEGWYIKTEICDITTVLAEALNMADRFNRGQLSVIHFKDAVEDWL